MGFAPMDNPKIAIAVYVENAGFGATYGVPIGSLMMEKYLTGEVKRTDLENRMMNANTITYGGASRHKPVVKKDDEETPKEETSE